MMRSINADNVSLHVFYVFLVSDEGGVAATIQGRFWLDAAPAEGDTIQGDLCHSPYHTNFPKFTWWTNSLSMISVAIDIK